MARFIKIRPVIDLSLGTKSDTDVYLNIDRINSIVDKGTYAIININDQSYTIDIPYSSIITKINATVV